MALVCVALIGAACGGDDGDTVARRGPAGQLSGMKGTTPLVELASDFKSALNASWVAAGNAGLQDFNYAAETYDAVTVVALAVEQAKSDGTAYARLINGITREGTKCEDFASCKAVIDADGNVDYDGRSGPLELSDNGELLEASYGVLQFGDDNRLDDTTTTYRPAAAPTAADIPPQDTGATGARGGDGVLKIGSILPRTGSLAFLGPPTFAGFALAIADINATGGVLGNPVEGIQGDSGDATTDTVDQVRDRLLAENVDAIIGAAPSAAGVVQFSPANTSKFLSTKFLSTGADNGLYFRTAPSDILQGQVLGEVIAEDGARNVAIINRNDAYGVGLTEQLTKALVARGANVVLTKTYDTEADSFDTEVDDIKGVSPDAVVIIGFAESSKILTAMVEAGIGPADMAVYGCDGNMGNSLGASFDKGE